MLVVVLKMYWRESTKQLQYYQVFGKFFVFLVMTEYTLLRNCMVVLQI
jgi:hypothetical protein